MEKALVCQRVANRLWATEAAIDTALAEAASLMTTMADARTEMGLSAVVAQDATSKVAQAIATLAEARRAVIDAHDNLAETKLRIGVRTKLIGITDKPPPSVETDMRNLREVG